MLKKKENANNSYHVHFGLVHVLYIIHDVTGRTLSHKVLISQEQTHDISNMY